MLLDVLENEKQDTHKQARLKVATKIKNRIEELTGESLHEDLLDKLASSDEKIMEVIDLVTTKFAGAAESLGGPSDETSSSNPLTNKEAAEAADSRLQSWLMS